MREQPSRKPAISKILVLIFIFLIFVVAYAGSLVFYFNEGAQKTSDLGTEVNSPDNIAVLTYVTAVDPIKGELQTRSEFTPNGSFIKDEKLAITQDLNLFITNSAGKQENTFEANKVMNSVDATVPFTESRPTDYPFDVHKGEMELYLTDPAKSENIIPVSFNFFGSMPGFNIEAVEDKLSVDTVNFFKINFKVTRSTTTKFFAVFIMVAMWVVSLSVLAMSFALLNRQRKVETGMFTYVAALIFALPAVRNIQPNIPPIGTLSDFISFFWAEIIAIACLIIVAYCWLRKET